MKVKEMKSNGARAVPLREIELAGGDCPLYHPNFDIQSLPNVDVVCDLTKRIPLSDDCIDKIYSKDFIEHITFEQFLSLLKECRRVLRYNGRIEFIIPDAEASVKVHHDWNENLFNTFFGRWDELGHKMWWSPFLMHYILRVEGWEIEVIAPYEIDKETWKEPRFKATAWSR